eukprot:6677654-Prymnesium_polylepis.1
MNDDRVLSAQALLALALMGLWTAHGMHIIALMPALGPLVRMTEYMVRDVFRWLLLLCVVLVAFSAATFTIHKGFEHPTLTADRGDADDCLVLARSKHDSLLFNARHLFRIAIGGEVERDFDCQEQGFDAIPIELDNGDGSSSSSRYATGEHLLQLVSPALTML